MAGKLARPRSSCATDTPALLPRAASRVSCARCWARRYAQLRRALAIMPIMWRCGAGSGAELEWSSRCWARR